MISTVLKKMFGSRNDRLLRKFSHAVQATNALEPAMQKLSDGDLRARTDLLRARAVNGESLDELLVEASGKSHISLQDFAVAMIDELDHPAHIRKRFTVGY